MVRNLLQYPVTFEEKMDLLDEFIQFRTGMDLIGDMKLVTLHTIRDDVITLQQMRQNNDDSGLRDQLD